LELSLQKKHSDPQKKRVRAQNLSQENPNAQEHKLESIIPPFSTTDVPRFPPPPPNFLLLLQNRISAFQHPMFLHKDWPQHLEQSFGAMATSIIYHINVFCVTYLIMVDRIHHLHTSSTPFILQKRLWICGWRKVECFWAAFHKWSHLHITGAV
jgi:hypothetical protein